MTIRFKQRFYFNQTSEEVERKVKNRGMNQ